MTRGAKTVYQSIRIASSCLLSAEDGNPVLKVPVHYDPVTETHFVLWSGVQRLLRGTAKYALHDGCLAAFLKDDFFNELAPQRIAYYPSIVLDIVTSDAQSQTDASAMDDLEEAEEVEEEEEEETVVSANVADLSIQQAHSSSANVSMPLPTNTLAREEAFPPIVNTAEHTHSILAAEVSILQANNTALEAKLAETTAKLRESMQETAALKSMDRRADVIVQDQNRAILGTPFQLGDYPHPRLFLILPTELHSVDGVLKPHWRHFRLFFLCECGAHKGQKRSDQIDSVHWADHCGYEIEHPEDMLSTFHRHILDVVSAIQSERDFVTFPPLSSKSGLAEEVQRIEAKTRLSIPVLMAMSIDYLQNFKKCRPDPDPKPSSELCSRSLPGPHLGIEWGMTGFLSYPSSIGPFGNLYRSVTEEGDVFWLCWQHSQEAKHANVLLQLSRVVAACPRSSVNEGRVIIQLESDSQARGFYDVLVQARNMVHELEVEFNYNPSQGSIQSLADAVFKSAIMSLVLRNNPMVEVPQRRRFDPLMALLATGRLQYAYIYLNHDIFEQVGKLSGLSSFSSLRRLSLRAGVRERNHSQVVEMLRKCTILQSFECDFDTTDIALAFVNCMEACPTLIDVNLQWFCSSPSTILSLMDKVFPILSREHQGSDGVDPQYSLRSLEVRTLDGSIVFTRSVDGIVRFSESLRRFQSLRPMFIRYGWALERFYFERFHQEGNSFDVNWWADSINQKGCVSNLLSMMINEPVIQPKDRQPLLRILESSRGLKRLTLNLPNVSGYDHFESSRWCLIHLGSWVSILYLRGKGIQDQIALLLTRRVLPRLTELHIVVLRLKDEDIGWLTGLLSGETGSQPKVSEGHVVGRSIVGLQKVFLYNMHVQDENWRLLIKALNFSTLRMLIFEATNFGHQQWDDLLDCLPRSGQFKNDNGDVFPVPLEVLSICASTLAALNVAKEGTLQAAFEQRAPFADLFIHTQGCYA